MKKYLLLLITLTSVLNIFAQPLIDDLELENSVIQVNYQKKSTRLALLMSAILPGAGSVYVNPNRWIGYIFPIIEGALLYGYISYRQDATDQERAYEKYVNGEIITLTDPNSGAVIYEGTRYNRDFQNLVQEYVAGVNTADIYDLGANGIFRLDPENSQHFYEDVGKYKKYIFGWVDWYEKYAYDGNDSLVEGYIPPTVNWSSDADDANHTILNYSITNVENYDNDQYQGLNTPMRAEYIQMRRDAQDKYDSSNYFLYGMLLNRVVSAVDASLAVRKYNQNYISQNNFQFNYAATTKNNIFTPMLFVTQRF